MPLCSNVLDAVEDELQIHLQEVLCRQRNFMSADQAQFLAKNLESTIFDFSLKHGKYKEIRFRIHAFISYPKGGVNLTSPL